MSSTKITAIQKTSAQIAAEFATAFKDVEPAAAKPLTQEERLGPYRKEIMKQRRRGMSWKQIATVMSGPVINEKVSEKLLRKVFGREEGSPKTEAERPRLPRLILDRATGLPITEAPVAPAVSAPAPMTAQEHARFDELLRGLIPPIVKTKMNRSDARSYANNAVERFKPKEAERFHEVLQAELDGLTEATAAQYGIAPELIAPWKKRWA